MSYEILRFQDSYTDKAWVIEHGHSQICVWHGSTLWQAREGHSGQMRELNNVNGNTSSYARAAKKRREGYQPWEGVTFDPQSRRIVADTVSVEDLPDAQPALWYRLQSTALSAHEVTQFLDGMRSGLGAVQSELDSLNLPFVERALMTVNAFEQVSIVKELAQGNLSGSVLYDESPMAPFILLALSQIPNLQVLVSDDQNQALPFNFSQLRGWLTIQHANGLMPWDYTDHSCGTDHRSAVTEILGLALCGIKRPTDLSKFAPARRAVMF